MSTNVGIGQNSDQTVFRYARRSSLAALRDVSMRQLAVHKLTLKLSEPFRHPAQTYGPAQLATLAPSGSVAPTCQMERLTAPRRNNRACAHMHQQAVRVYA